MLHENGFAFPEGHVKGPAPYLFLMTASTLIFQTSFCGSRFVLIRMCSFAVFIVKVMR